MTILDDRRVPAAAVDNADRVDRVVRAAGVVTHRDARRWWAETRTPPYHPDAVTLLPGLTAEEVLDGIDTSDGCSVKDSFVDLDLTAYGFRVLLDGSWLWRDGGEAPVFDWERTDEVPVAVAAGFQVIGPMRVWIRGDPT